jgi:hypothetical protein
MLSIEDALASKEDEKAKLSARKFLFIVNNDEVIDPTNKAGLLDLELTFLGGLIKVDTLVARINQPPLGKKINVYTKINGPDAVVLASKDIFADEEILMDCGRYEVSADDILLAKERDEKEAKRLADIIRDGI